MTEFWTEWATLAVLAIRTGNRTGFQFVLDVAAMLTVAGMVDSQIPQAS